MTYLLYGTNNYLIKEKINEIIADNLIDSDSISKYSFENTIEEIIDDITSLPLFSDKKLVIVEDFTFDNTKELEQYLEKENEQVVLVIIINSETIDKRRKLFKSIKNVFEYNKADAFNIAKKMFEDYKISDNTIRLLINRVGNSIDNLKNEIDKLKLYKIEEKEIKEEDILTTIKYISDDIFYFIDNVVNKNNEVVFEIYEEMLKKKTDPSGIIVLLANQIRLMYQVKKLVNQYNVDSIAEILEVHPYRVKLAVEKSKMYSSEVLLSLLEKLANLDIDIKSGKVEPEIGIELFLLGI